MQLSSQLGLVSTRQLTVHLDVGQSSLHQADNWSRWAETQISRASVVLHTARRDAGNAVHHGAVQSNHEEVHLHFSGWAVPVDRQTLRLSRSDEVEGCIFRAETPRALACRSSSKSPDADATTLGYLVAT